MYCNQQCKILQDCCAAVRRRAWHLHEARLCGSWEMGAIEVEECHAGTVG